MYVKWGQKDPERPPCLYLWRHQRTSPGAAPAPPPVRGRGPKVCRRQAPLSILWVRSRKYLHLQKCPVPDPEDWGALDGGQYGKTRRKEEVEERAVLGEGDNCWRYIAAGPWRETHWYDVNYCQKWWEVGGIRFNSFQWFVFHAL